MVMITFNGGSSTVVVDTNNGGHGQLNADAATAINLECADGDLSTQITLAGSSTSIVPLSGITALQCASKQISNFFASALLVFFSV